MSGAQWPFTNLGIRFFEGQLPELTRNIGKLADELKRYNDAAEKDPHTQPENAEAYIAAAKKQWSRGGEIEIDGDAKVSAGDDPVLGRDSVDVAVAQVVAVAREIAKASREDDPGRCTDLLDDLIEAVAAMDR